MVDELIGTASTPFIQMEEFVSLVPDKVWGEMLIGEVTVFRAEIAGGIVSKVILVVIVVLLLPVTSHAVMDIKFSPSERLKS